MRHGPWVEAQAADVVAGAGDLSGEADDQRGGVPAGPAAATIRPSHDHRFETLAGLSLGTAAVSGVMDRPLDMRLRGTCASTGKVG